MVTAKLICAFVFAKAKIRFSHDAAHMFDKSYIDKSRNMSQVTRKPAGFPIMFETNYSITYTATEDGFRLRKDIMEETNLKNSLSHDLIIFYVL